MALGYKLRQKKKSPPSLPSLVLVLKEKKKETRTDLQRPRYNFIALLMNLAILINSRNKNNNAILLAHR